MKTNIITQKNINAPKTHEGAVAKIIGAEKQLRRSVMCCMLFEDSAYEDGVSISHRISELVQVNDPEVVANIAIEAREKMKLRHVPLFLCSELAKIGKLKKETLERVVQRADEITEFLAIYSKGRVGTKLLNKLSKQAQKGLALAFRKFSAHDLQKYNRAGTVSLKDALFLTHPLAKDAKQEEDWMRLTEGYCEVCWQKLDKHDKSHEPKIACLPIADTWEVQISKVGEFKGTEEEKKELKKQVWTRLLTENKLKALALLKNLRNLTEAGVSTDLIKSSILKMKIERVLPFRFISTSRYAPALEEALEFSMFKCLGDQEKLKGKTVLLVDCSGSMDSKVSDKSELSRKDAAAGLAILIREICEDVSIVGFADSPTVIAPRRGFALRDAIAASPSGGTNTDTALAFVEKESYDRIIVITDEQSHQTIRGPKSKLAYFINVSVEKNGIGYGKWNHIDGWSESIIDYIRSVEKE